MVKINPALMFSGTCREAFCRYIDGLSLTELSSVEPLPFRRVLAAEESKALWSRLRGRKVDGWKFRRQQPIGPYFVDFYCPAAKLIVEIDGPAHQGDATWAYDLRRQAWLETEGHRMLRISVSQISRDLNEVIETIYVVLLEQEKRGFFRRPHRPAPPATSPRAGKS